MSTALPNFVLSSCSPGLQTRGFFGKGPAPAGYGVPCPYVAAGRGAACSMALRCMAARCISACARTLAKAGGFEMRTAKRIRLRPRETEAHPGAPKNGNKPTGEDERDDGCLHADTGDHKTDRGQHINYAVEGLIFIELVELKL